MGFGFRAYGTTPYSALKVVGDSVQIPITTKRPRAGLYLSPSVNNTELTDIFIPSWGIEGFSIDINHKTELVTNSHGEVLTSSKTIKGRTLKLEGHVIESDYWQTSSDYLRKFAQGNYNLFLAEENLDVNGNIEDMQLVKSYSQQRNYKDIDTDGVDMFVVSDAGLEVVSVATGIRRILLVPTAGSYTTCAHNIKENCVFVFHDTGTTSKLLKVWIEDSSVIIIKEVDLTVLAGATVNTTYRCDIDSKHIFIACSNASAPAYILKIDIADLTLKAKESFTARRFGIAIINNDIVAVVKNNGDIDIINYLDLKQRQTITATLTTATNHGLTSDGSHVWVAETNTNKIYRYNKNFTEHITTLPTNTFVGINGIATHNNKLYIVEKNATGMIKQYYKGQYRYNNNDRSIYIDSSVSIKEKYIKGNSFLKSEIKPELFCGSPFWQESTFAQDYFILNSSSSEFRIETKGFVSHPIFSILIRNSSLGNITIKHENTNTKMKLLPTTPFPFFDIVVIDEEKGTVSANGVDMISSFSGNFPTLQTGTNYFKVTSSTTGWQIGMKVSYRNLYL